MSVTSKPKRQHRKVIKVPQPFMDQCYPIDPLIEFAMKRWRPNNECVVTFSPSRQACDVMGMFSEKLSQWTKAGKQIDSVEADRIAVKLLGVHPSAIWKDWFDPDDSLDCEDDEGEEEGHQG